MAGAEAEVDGRSCKGSEEHDAGGYEEEGGRGGGSVHLHGHRPGRGERHRPAQTGTN